MALAAITIFLLAYYQPVEQVGSDPAMALVAAQALLDHGTLDLGVYQDHPDFAYEFDVYNYRVKELFGGHYYVNLGQPVVSVPIVFAANLLGYDMLDQETEFAVQNLVSAVLTALVFVLMVQLGRLYVGPGPGLAVALVTTLGSCLVSTLATALWSTDFQVVLLSGVLLLIARRGGDGIEPKLVVLLGGVLGAAFLLRPTAAFLAVAVLLYLLAEKNRLVVLGARIALGLGAAVAVLVTLEAVPWLRYYSPRKMLPSELPWKGFYGVVAGPSRGLFVYCPFLIPVVAAATRRFRALWDDRFLRLTATWMTLHVAGVALKGVWWGGQCFGPRLLTEIMPGFVILTAWAWRELSDAGASRRRTALMASYAGLGLLAVFIHSYQALFNPATHKWNTWPNIDNPKYHELLLSWRYPQFLATDDSITERFLDLQRRTAGVYRLGEELGHDSPDLLFAGWHQPEDGWRWSRGTSSELRFQLDAAPAGPAFFLALRASSLGEQTVRLSLNGAAVGERHFEGADVVYRVFVARGEVLRVGENVLRLEVPGARSAPPDVRVLGVALRSLRLVPWGGGFAVSFREDALFAAGFSVAEDGWRWSDGREARLLYPVAGIEVGKTYELELVAGAYGEQRVEVLVNGRSLGEAELRGAEARVTRLAVSGDVLRPYAANSIALLIPGAARQKEDARLLGLRFVSLRVLAPGSR